MPPSFKKPIVVTKKAPIPVKPITQLALPAKKAPIQPISKLPPKSPVSTRPAVAPLKTTLPRPVLRAFECLVNVEHAKKSIEGVGIFVGPDAEKQRALVEQITQDLIQLHLSYKTYWKQVAISTGDSNAVD